MSTAVKIDEEAKAELEALQAEIKLKTGKKVTQQEILSQLIRSATDDRSTFIDSFRDGQVALNEAAIEQFNKGKISSGVETDETDIDEILYG
ncbi:hypothetical protein [Halonotius sp. GCM10025705]|uniref:hypothetical protein n=1 Tax=Halonotius sp. GCM10025705 TaxID=3252678 RepID=UPI003619D647